MDYLLMLYVPETGWQALTDAQKAEGLAAYAAYSQALQQAGALKAGARLRPTADATTVRLADGKPQVLDGPYGESKEQLGGYFLIDVPDLDAAIAWASRCPAAGHGAVEVRPLWPM